MYKANDYLVYKKDVCKVIEVKKNKMNGLYSLVVCSLFKFTHPWVFVQACFKKTFVNEGVL